jgi:hypothetical protein
VLPEAARVIEFMLSDEEGRKMDFWKHHFSVFKKFICIFDMGFWC